MADGDRPGTLGRHDLLHVDPKGWRAALDRHPEAAALPSVAGWAERGWPVIVRRRTAGEEEVHVPAALALPPALGGRRVGLTLPPDIVIRRRPPPRLRDAARTAPEAWRRPIEALLRLGTRLGVEPAVFGALLWRHVTGVPYLTAASDLDLLWRVTAPGVVPDLLSGLAALDAEGPVRLDGEVIFAGGAAVNWRELRGGADRVLVKTMRGVEERSVEALLEAAVPA